MDEFKTCAFCGYRYNINEEISICHRCLHDIDTGERMSSMAIAFKLNARHEEVKERRRRFEGDDIKLAKSYYGERYKNDRFINRKEAVKLSEKYGVRLDTVIDRLVRGDTVDEIDASLSNMNINKTEIVNGKRCTMADLGRMFGKSVCFIKNRKARFGSLQALYDYLSIPENMLIEEGRINYHGEILTYSDAAIRVGKKKCELMRIVKERGISYAEAVDMIAEKRGLKT